MQGHNGVGRVDHDLAEIVRGAGVFEQAVFDQSLFILQGVQLLRVADIVQENAEDVQNKHERDQRRCQRHVAADKQIRREVVSCQREEDKNKSNKGMNFFFEAFVGVERVFDEPEDAVRAVNGEVDEGFSAPVVEGEHQAEDNGGDERFVNVDEGCDFHVCFLSVLYIYVDILPVSLISVKG